MALDKALLGRLLQLNEPWTVREFRFDPGARRVDAWIGLEVQRGWFGLGRKQADQEGAERVWRHIDLAGWRCHLHVLAPASADLSALPWAGPADMPFSQALSKQVFALFNEGVSLNGICAITGIPLQELWKFKFALDQGKAAITDPARAAVAAQAAVAADAAAPAVASDDDVPDVADPVWLQLIEGRRDIDIRALSLKLLMTRLRSQMEVITDDEVRMLKLRELHRYFVKNARMLGHELAQLRTH